MDWLDGIGNWVGGLFSGGGAQGGGGGWGPVLASLATAGIGAYGNIAASEAARGDADAQAQMLASEAEKERQFKAWSLLTQLAAQKGGGGGGGGGGSAAAMANVRRQGLADAVGAAAQRQKANNDSLSLFLQGIQNPYARILGG